MRIRVFWTKPVPMERPPNRTLMNGLRVLEYLASEYREVSVTDLAQALNLPKSHVHRLLQSLVSVGYVSKCPDTRKYRCDYRLLALAGPFAESIPLRKYGGPVLRELSEATQASSYIGVLHQNAPLVMMEHLVTGPNQRIPWGWLSRHASAFGKLFLALKRLPVNPVELQRFSSSTITSVEQLEQELALIRRQGYSVNRREGRANLYSFAAPICGEVGTLLGAVGLATSADVVEKRGEEFYIGHVVAAAEKLSAMAERL